MQGYTWRDRMSFSVPSGSAPGTQRIDGTRGAWHALDNHPRGRHPDCPLGPSLVVSRIALTVWGPTYRHRSEQFAATILSSVLATAIFDDRDGGVHGADQLSRANDYFGRYLPLADEHYKLRKLDFRRQSAGLPHDSRG